MQSILYLLFTEGYLSSHAEAAIRRELCDEAKRLTLLLAEHPLGATPETFALLALMHLHAARTAARQDGSLAPAFAETRWARIVECYTLLERLAPSPLHTLNRAVAVAELHGPLEGLAIVEGLEPPSWLAGSYLWAAVLADLHRRCGHDELAQRYRDTALESAPSALVRDALQRRLQADRG